jgi:hypothetical protein
MDKSGFSRPHLPVKGNDLTLPGGLPAFFRRGMYCIYRKSPFRHTRHLVFAAKVAGCRQY